MLKDLHQKDEDLIWDLQPKHYVCVGTKFDIISTSVAEVNKNKIREV